VKTLSEEFSALKTQLAQQLNDPFVDPTFNRIHRTSKSSFRHETLNSVS
jgi:hypothetical protein